MIAARRHRSLRWQITMADTQPLAPPNQRSYAWLVILGVTLLLLGLPVAAWLDMRDVISEHSTGVDLFLDLDVMDRCAAERTRRLPQQALAAIDAKAKPGTA